MDTDQNSSRPAAPVKGRGAASNPDNRFHPWTHQDVDDGWSHQRRSQDEPAAAPQTQVLEQKSRTIITSNRSPDIPFDYSINPYRGCEHGCIYCYARPTHAYWDLSPGLDFETKIISRPDAAALLRNKLESPRYKVSPICIGANTDPYQPIESRLEITRSVIEVLSEFRHPFSIITKSSLIQRDLDLLTPLAAQNLCSVAVSVTTLDNSTKRTLEPRAPSGHKRLATVKALADAGVRVTLLAAPMIPFINDHELENILAAGKDAGAIASRYILLRLPLEISDMFQEWLQLHYPERAGKVMNIIRQSRGGLDYRSVFGERMVGTGPFAELLNQRWRVASRKNHYDNDASFELNTGLFRRDVRQLPLF